MCEIEVIDVYSPSKFIFKEEDLATFETGANAAAPTSEAIVIIVRNIFIKL